MKITKKQLKQLIAEARVGSVGIGFQGWSANKAPDFSKSFGSEGSYASDLLKSKIRNIVREEVEVNEYKEQSITPEQAAGASLEVSTPGEVETVSDAWGGGSNLVHSIDHSKAVDSDPVTRGQETLKLTESQLRKVIKRQLNEMWGDSVETGSDLIEFAKAYAGLGDAVQAQVDAVVAAYNNGGFSPEFDEVVYEQNPNAIELAFDRLERVLNMMDSEDGETISDALREAMKIYQKGEDEVEADARAAGDL